MNIAVTIIVAGNVLLAIAFVISLRSILITLFGKTTPGVIVGLVEDGEGAFAPIVRFEAAGGTVEFRDTIYQNPPRRVGSTVKVLYWANKPHQAKIKSWSSLFLLPAGIAIIGGTLLAAGIGLTYL